MSLHLYNTLTKKKEKCTPFTEGRVTIYTCGPTVYSRPHIGNYASFLMADLLCRWLEVLGLQVTHVKNITDVGHLVADSSADASGEDKIERKAREEKIDPLLIAQKYADAYLNDERSLGMREPEFRPRATETIQEMIAIIRILLKSSHAYETEDGIYFSVQSFPGYGKLSGNTLANLGKLEEGVRVELAETKRHPADFALWKKCVGVNAIHILRWNFPSGERIGGAGEDPSAGFPGWHIECSAMSTKFLGERIDIHTGGEDNIFPHHECEIAQSECASSAPFVRYWMHKRRVNFANEKMSKSLGNVLSLDDIKERGFSPLDLRFFFLSTHYRSHTQFTWKGLEDAKKSRLKISEWIANKPWNELLGTSKERGESLLELRNMIQDWNDRFILAMNDDLNAPAAIAVIFEAISGSRLRGHWSVECQELLSNFMRMLEASFACFSIESFSVPVEIQNLAHQREQYRLAGDYAQSDALRAELLKRGFVIEDTVSGPKVVPRASSGISLEEPLQNASC